MIVLSAVAVALAKRAYPKAAILSLLKRVIGFALGRILPFRTPVVAQGKGSISTVGSTINTCGRKKPLIVTDEMLVKHGLVQKCIDSIQAAGLEHEVYDKVVPNPPTENVEDGYAIYKDKKCDCIVAFGGGSSMDVAKIIGVKACNGAKPVRSYAGFFKATYGIFKTLPPTIAVPTTAGTGSEATIASVISDVESERKFAIADLELIPHYAVLDPVLLEKLPKHITAATGMDALTHAIESFLSGWSTGFTRTQSLEAVGKIFKNIECSYDNGSDLNAREEMLSASFQAGVAFTRANVGYVHAIAHQFGAMFHVPHGDANAMLLPHVLEFYLSDEKSGNGSCHCVDMYCKIAVAGGLAQSVPEQTSSRRELAQELVARIRKMNEYMAIPAEVSAMKASQVEEVAKRALKEAHGEVHSILSLSWVLDLGYPTPKYMTQAECETIISKVLPAKEQPSSACPPVGI
jgi:alcohol dehydrogenase class IV